MSSEDDDFIEGGAPAPVRVKQVQEDAKAEEVRKRERLRHAYAQVFSGGHTDQDNVDIVMQDLAVFGRMFETTVPAAGSTPMWPQEVLEGRRQVALRIMEHGKLSLDALFRRYHQG